MSCLEKFLARFAAFREKNSFLESYDANLRTALRKNIAAEYHDAFDRFRASARLNWDEVAEVLGYERTTGWRWARKQTTIRADDMLAYLALRGLSPNRVGLPDGPVALLGAAARTLRQAWSEDPHSFGWQPEVNYPAWQGLSGTWPYFVELFRPTDAEPEPPPLGRCEIEALARLYADRDFEEVLRVDPLLWARIGPIEGGPGGGAELEIASAYEKIASRFPHGLPLARVDLHRGVNLRRIALDWLPGWMLLREATSSIDWPGEIVRAPRETTGDRVR